MREKHRAMNRMAKVPKAITVPFTRLADALLSIKGGRLARRSITAYVKDRETALQLPNPEGTLTALAAHTIQRSEEVCR